MVESIHITTELQRCVCSKFMRILKYNMKGFFDSISLAKELNQAESISEIIFEKQDEGYECKFCFKKIK